MARPFFFFLMDISFCGVTALLEGYVVSYGLVRDAQYRYANNQFGQYHANDTQHLFESAILTYEDLGGRRLASRSSGSGRSDVGGYDPSRGADGELSMEADEVAARYGPGYMRLLLANTIFTACMFLWWATFLIAKQTHARKSFKARVSKAAERERQAYPRRGSNPLP